MEMQRTFAMIKPDAVEDKHIGHIVTMIEQAGFKIAGLKMLQFTKQCGQMFYAVHSARPFFGELVDHISSGPVVAMVLEKENAVVAWRDLIGATDPAKAAEGTVRQRYARNIGANAVHGSDATETAQDEIAMIFPELSGRKGCC